MAPVTIPQKLARHDDLVIIPRGEYEEFLRMKKLLRVVKPMKSEQKSIAQGRRAVIKKQYRAWPLR